MTPASSIFVTGGSSVIGKAVLSGLPDDYLLVCLEHTTPLGPGGTNIETVTGDLTDPASYASRLNRADIVLHMAGLTHAGHPDDYFTINLEGTRQLLQACRPGQPFVYLSTICAAETAGAYGHSKYLAEKAIMESDRPFAILRPAEVYGSQPGRGIDRWLDIAFHHRLLLDFICKRSIPFHPVSVDELASAVLETLKPGRMEGSVYSICSDRPYSIEEIGAALEKRMNRKLHRIPVPIGLLRVLCAMRLPVPFERDQLDRLVMEKPTDNTRARTELGLAPKSFLSWIEEGGVEKLFQRSSKW
jgi:nucleoside-diphosphate-sugar epimerase